MKICNITAVVINIVEIGPVKTLEIFIISWRDSALPSQIEPRHVNHDTHRISQISIESIFIEISDHNFDLKQWRELKMDIENIFYDS